MVGTHKWKLSLLYVHADVFVSYTVGVPVPKPPNDEPLEQLVNLSQQEEVRNF